MKRPSAEFEALTISANEGTADLDQYSGRYRYRYTVTVRSDATERSIRFTYYDSTANYDAGHRGLAGNDLLFAFWAFCQDAAAGELDPYEFASDYGYDMDSCSARRIHQACKRARDQFGRLYHDDRDPSTTLERLAAIGIE